MDVFGFRVIVQSVSACYQVLGVVHSILKPLEGRFRDLIAIPKANGYQSLHTVLFTPYETPLEIQIRTEEMDLIADRGIAAHWIYKHGGSGNSAHVRAYSWVSELLEHQRTASSLEFLENVKVDLFPDEIYVFTPRGDILTLPRNATALDFAYAVHTDIGNHTVAMRVDGKSVALRAKLSNGQKVEAITAQSASPQPQWLEFVVSSKARTAIRHQLKNLGHGDAVQFGHRMLDYALEAIGSSLDRVPADRLKNCLSEMHYPRLEALLADIALGNRMPMQMAQMLSKQQYDDSGVGVADDLKPQQVTEQILITGLEGGVIHFANCCMPIPGDGIMGYHTAGRGMVVHRISCVKVAEYRKSPECCVLIGWDRDVSGNFQTKLLIEVDNHPGVLAQVAAAIAQAKSNIYNVEYVEQDANVAAMFFALEVRNRKHLVEIIRRSRRLSVVHGIKRVRSK